MHHGMLPGPVNESTCRQVVLPLPWFKGGINVLPPQRGQVLEVEGLRGQLAHNTSVPPNPSSRNISSKDHSWPTHLVYQRTNAPLSSTELSAVFICTFIFRSVSECIVPLSVCHTLPPLLRIHPEPVLSFGATLTSAARYINYLKFYSLQVSSAAELLHK